MKFTEVLDRAWHIVWKHKVLWVFGILAGFGSGGGGAGGGSGWEQSAPSGTRPFTSVEQFMTSAGQWIGEHLWIVVVFVILILVLAAAAIFLGTMGRIGLIRGTFEADGGAERLAFGRLFRESLPYFWRVFGLSLLIGLAFVIVFVPLVLFGLLTAGVGFLLVLPLLCVLVPLAWAAGILIHQANAAMVIEDRTLTDGLRRGWEVLTKNLGSLLIIWLITAVIGLVVGILIALPVLVIVIPTVIGLLTAGQQVSWVFLLIGAVCFIVYLPILIVASGILTAYLQSVWTLTFMRLTRPKEAAETSVSLPADA
jgi:hypothetical protein